MPLWNNETADYQRSFGFEHMGNKAFRQGSWKIVFTNKHSLNPEERWELYDIDNDPGEVKNLAHQYPERLTHMIHLYDRWAVRVGVFEPYDSLILAHPF